MIKKIILALLLVGMTAGSLCSCQHVSKLQVDSEISFELENIDGYEYAPFEKFNSYAEDNGLKGTKIYIKGKVTRIDAIENVTYAIVNTNDGTWSIILGYTPVSEIESLYKDKEISVFGSYSGYSNTLKTPDILVDKIECDGKEKSYNQLSDFMQITEPSTVQEEDSSNGFVLETTQIDYHKLSNKEFAEKVATDFSTDSILFSFDDSSNDTYFLKASGTEEIDDIMISCSDYGNILTFTCSKNSTNEDAYDVLMKGLKSELFGLSFDEQVEILAQFQVGTVNFKSKTPKIPIKITEKDNNYSRLIFIKYDN